MNRLLRTLTLTAGALLFLAGSRSPVSAQIGTMDGSCCDLDYTNTTGDLRCGHCSQGPYSNFDFGAAVATSHSVRKSRPNAISQVAVC